MRSAAPARADTGSFTVKVSTSPIVTTADLEKKAANSGFLIDVFIGPPQATLRVAPENPAAPDDPLPVVQSIQTPFVASPGMIVDINVAGVHKSGQTLQTQSSDGVPVFYARFKYGTNDFRQKGVPAGPVGIRAVAWESTSGTEGFGVLLRGEGFATTLFSTRAPVPGLSTAIDSGDAHTCAAIADGSIRCWGAGTRNQIGDGKGLDAPSAATVQAPAGRLEGVVALDVGANHSCAIVAGAGAPVETRLWCWGDNRFGQLGSLNFAPSATAIEARRQPGQALVNVVDVAAGRQHTCAVIVDSTVRCWGIPATSGKAPWLGEGSASDPVMLVTATGSRPLTGVVQVAAGYRHTCALTMAGRVYCFGDPSDGRLGSSYPSRPFAPQQVPGVADASWIVAGPANACAVTSSETICWGMNVSGQLGRGEAETEDPRPVQLAGVPTAIALGASHSCFIVDVTVSCSGENAEGQFGDGTTSAALRPVAIANASRSIGLSVGDHHSCYVGPRGEVAFVRCSGLNDHAQLGDDGFEASLAPILTAGLSGVAEITTGDAHTCALLAGGDELRCWGSNTDGQLGDGTTSQRVQPVGPPPANRPPAGMFGIQAGGDHTCMLVGVSGDAAGDDLYCWGDNSSGQLGNGTVADATVPVKIAGLSPLAIALGRQHTCAVLPSAPGRRRSVACWGANDTGQLGDDSTTGRSTPRTVVGLDGTQPFDITAIDAGDAHTCVVLTNATLLCWGSNISSQLGTTSVAIAKRPRKVEYAAGVVGVAGGGDFTCYTDAEGVAYCFGGNAFGQLGTIGPESAIPIYDDLDFTGVATLSAGTSHVCAIAIDGQLVCRGSNATSQLGDDTSPESYSESEITSAPGEVVDTAPGLGHTCVVLFSASAMCWGANANGQIGDGTTDLAPFPVAIDVT